MAASALIMLTTSLPVIVGALGSDPAWVFSGTAYNRQDFAVHQATMRWAEDTGWVYSLPFTTETTPAAPVKLAYVALGKLNGLLNWNPVVTYHLMRFLLGWGALMLVYALMRRIFSTVWNRRLAFLMASLASGLGWLQLIVGALPDPSISPIDYWLSDAYLYFSLMLFPHFAMVAICLLGAILGYDLVLDRADGRGWLLVLMCTFLIIAIQPFSISIAYLCLAGLVIGRWRATNELTMDMIYPIVILLLIQLPVLWSNYAAFNQDEVWRSFGSQVIMMSPPPIYYLMGMGVLTPLAIYGAWLAWRDRNVLGLMASVWVAGVAILLYLPSQFQRRFSLLITIPFTILAIMAVKDLADKVGTFKPSIRMAQLLLLVFVSISSIYLVTGGVLLVLSRHDEIYDPNALIQALDWLEEQAEPGDCAISSPRTGLVVPTRTSVRSYAAHPVETAFYEIKLERLNQFFGDRMSLQERQYFLEQTGCRWIIVGPYEGVSVERLQADMPELVVAYANQMVTIFHRSIGEGESR